MSGRGSRPGFRPQVTIPPALLLCGADAAKAPHHIRLVTVRSGSAALRNSPARVTGLFTIDGLSTVIEQDPLVFPDRCTVIPAAKSAVLDLQ